MKKSFVKTPLRLFLSLILAAAVLCGFALTANAADAVVVNLDFCARHTALAEQLAASLGTEADGSVVSVSVTLEEGEERTILNVMPKLYDLLYSSGIMDTLDGNYKHAGEQYDGIGLKPLSAYADRDEYLDEQNSHWETAVNNGDTFYVHWKTPVENVVVTIEPPVCGTEVHFINEYAAGGGNSSPTTSPAPSITVTGDAYLFLSPFNGYTDGYWTDNEYGGSFSYPYDGYLNATIEGGESYFAAFQLSANFGLYIDNDPSDAIKINGAAPVYQNNGFFVASVTAVHRSDEIESSAAPTCTEPGAITYVCGGCGNSFTEEIPATGHAWGDPEWSWSEDGATAAATFSCANGNHPKTVEATVTQDEALSIAPSCNAGGIAVYCGTAVLENETFSAQKTVSIPATGHIYENATWRWADDYSLVVASLICKSCSDKKTLIADTSKTRTEPTASRDGAIVYTASVTVADQSFSDSRTTVLPATGESADGKAGKDRFLSAFFAWLIELIQMITRWFTK